MWTVGPLRPKVKPEPKTRIVPTDLTKATRRERGRENCAKTALTWGIPPPVAAGENISKHHPAIIPIINPPKGRIKVAPNLSTRVRRRLPTQPIPCLRKRAAKAETKPIKQASAKA